MLLENKLVDELLVNILPARSFVSHSQRQKAEMNAQLLQAALAAPNSFRQMAMTLDAAPAYVAYADLATADLCRRAGRLDRAAPLLIQAHAQYNQAGDLAGAALCEMTWGDWLAAPATSPLVWNFVIQEGNEDSALSWTTEVNEFTGSTIDLAGAQAAYARAESLFTSAGAERGLATLHLRNAYLAAHTGQYGEAARLSREAHQHFTTVGDWRGVCLAQAHQALSAVGAGDTVEPAHLATAIGTWGREQGSFSFVLGIGLLFGRAGRYWLTRHGDYQRALAGYRLAHTLFTTLGAQSNAAQSLVDQGLAYQIIGEPTNAGALFEEARAAYASQLATVTTAEFAATVRWRLAQLEQAIYQIYERHRNTQGMAKSLQRLKELAAQPPPVLPEDTESQMAVMGYLASTQQLTALAEAAAVMLPRFRAVEARNAGDEAEADRQFALALAAAQQANPSQRDLLEATVLGQQRRYAEVQALFQRYLARGGANSGLPGKLADLLASVFGAEGQALAARQDENTLEQAALFYTVTKAYPAAKAQFDALEKVAGAEWWRRNARPWETLLDYGEVYAGLQQFAKALGYYERAITELDAQRRTLSRDELKIAIVSGVHAQRIHFGAARTAVRLGQAARAFTYIEQGKARALLDLMTSSALLADPNTTTGPTWRTWRQLTAQLATWRGLLARERNQDRTDSVRISEWQQRITADEAALAQVEATLAADYPTFQQVVTPQTNLLTVEEVSQWLPPNTLLLEYAFMDEDLLIWAITENGLARIHHATVDAKALERQIRHFHRACAKGQAVRQSGTALADLLLAPFADLLATHNKVIFVPSGAAYLLPFHALPWREQWLTETHTVAYLPSASILQFLVAKNNTTVQDRVLAIGNPTAMAYQRTPDQPPTPASPLPYAEIEAATVATLFPQGEALLAAQATKRAVTARLSDVPILHLATHGYLSETAPLLSAILLANGEALTVYELMGLQLKADLVVLSACETGRGETTGGDDLLGLTRGLLAAGTRAAVVSLWPVNDLATSLFMTRFYQHLRSGAPPATALQSAQNGLRSLSAERMEQEREQLKTILSERNVDVRELRPLTRHLLPVSETEEGLTGYSHPFYWAPFILIGTVG